MMKTLAAKYAGHKALQAWLSFKRLRIDFLELQLLESDLRY